MEKIAIGYVLLLIWCYMRAEISHRQTQNVSATQEQTPPSAASRKFTILSHAVFVAAVVLTIWGSGKACLFWLPAGFILAGLIQTLIPIQKKWR